MGVVGKVTTIEESRLELTRVVGKCRQLTKVVDSRQQLSMVDNR